MKRLIMILLVLLGSSVVGVFFAKHPGYMLLATKHWHIETTLWLGIILMFFISFVIIQCLRLIHKTIHIRSGMHDWIEGRRRRQSDRLSNLGLCELAEAHWRKAEDKLIRGAQHSPTPLMNYLSAAKAAQAQGALDRRDQYLKNAIESTPEASKAVGLSQAQLQLDANQLEQACATLQALRRDYPKHQHVLTLLQTTYTLLEDWPQLIDLSADLRRYRCLEKGACLALRLMAENRQFQNTLRMDDPIAIRNAWQSMDKAARTYHDNVLAYAAFCLQSGDHHYASELLLACTQRAWDPKALRLLAQLAKPHAEKAYQQAERWLADRPLDAELCDTLGKLSITLQLWSKAKHYLGKAIDIAPSAKRYFTLASVHQECQERAAMEKCIKDGLACDH